MKLRKKSQQLAENKEDIISLLPQKDGFVVLNPVAGEGNPDQIKETLRSTIGEERFQLYETTGDESVSEVVQSALADNNIGWLAAVGGDGTVSDVANGLVGTDIPLGVIPAGTGNAFAEGLGIPQDMEEASRLIADPARVRTVDGIKIGERTYFLQIGIGLESITMKKTSSDEKNLLGPAAYLWTALKEAFGWQPYHLTLTVDGQTHRLEGSELVFANTGKIGIFDLEWSESIAPDDGRIDIALARARSILDYAQVLTTLLVGGQKKADHIQFFEAFEEIVLDTEQSLPIHGDGEMLDVTMPMKAQVKHKVLRVIVPEKE